MHMDWYTLTGNSFKNVSLKHIIEISELKHKNGFQSKKLKMWKVYIKRHSKHY